MGSRSDQSHDLGASWASEDYVEEDHSNDEDSGEDTRSSSEEEINPTPDIQSTRLNHHISTPEKTQSHQTISSTRKANLRMTPTKTPPFRHSLGNGSKEESLEPSFIMPSPSTYGASEHVPPRFSPLSESKIRQRKYRSSSGSHKHNRQRPAAAPHQFTNPSGQQVNQGVPGTIFHATWEHVIEPSLEFVGSLLHMILHTLKPFLAFAIAFWILAMVLLVLRNRIYSAANSMLSPLCYVPGISYLSPSLCGNPQQSSGTVEFEQLLDAQSSFEDVLTSTSEIASLPYDMKRSEASIRDLRTVIRYSSLPSRNELSFEFDGFIESARQASMDLSAFDSRVGRAVDAVLSTNRWTLSVLSGVAEDEANKGLAKKMLAQIPLFSFRSSPDPRAIVLQQYLRHTRDLEDQVADVILEAQGLLMLLQSLDDRLDHIASIAARDGVTIKGSRDELLASLWTWLGGNKGSVKRLEQHLLLLRSVNQYQKTAWQHISATILKLQTIANQLEDLRERVAAPGNVGVREELPLEFHIENIRLGVERLEGARGESRRVQGEIYRKMVGDGEEKTQKQNSKFIEAKLEH
jgi:hypothetical protein